MPHRQRREMDECRHARAMTPIATLPMISLASLGSSWCLGELRDGRVDDGEVREWWSNGAMEGKNEGVYGEGTGARGRTDGKRWKRTNSTSLFIRI
ncbi:hypothetical protein DPEC_G00126270 [Dallia pectoralis]|uniref:Uncharacterized protein n=1 Tax=Dallia pectoralis TaxID=75939 RepID=A0ACC2GRG9_DALPE|nr:hypothetical protein DPEC_G00126270 [Dallia pectoralis]